MRACMLVRVCVIACAAVLCARMMYARMRASMCACVCALAFVFECCGVGGCPRTLPLFSCRCVGTCTCETWELSSGVYEVGAEVQVTVFLRDPQCARVYVLI